MSLLPTSLMNILNSLKSAIQMPQKIPAYSFEKQLSAGCGNTCAGSCSHGCSGGCDNACYGIALKGM